MSVRRRLQRLIRPDLYHRTRFHTLRGSLMPLASWATVVPSILARVTKKNTVEPWMPRPAIRYLDEIVDDTYRVFEFGSGYSTVWLARRCHELTSLEDEADWYERVVGLLARQGIQNCSLRLRPLVTFPDEVRVYPDSSFDLVIVDCTQAGGSRLRCVEASIPKVKPEAHLVLDDSDAPEYLAVDDMLAGWKIRRFVGWRGLRPGLHATETSFYRRPLN